MVKLATLTPWQRHVRQWGNCTACPLATTRTHICLARGETPAEVLFVGEAPGVSEDEEGLPFVGPAGKLFDHILRQSVELSRPFTYCVTNVVCCFPKNEAGQGREPNKEEIKACAPRLKELIWVVRPRLIVLVGVVAKKAGLCQGSVSNDKKDLTLPWLPSNGQVTFEGENMLHFEEIVHPAAIMRANPVQQSTLVQQSIVRIASAIDELTTPNKTRGKT